MSDAPQPAERLLLWKLALSGGTGLGQGSQAQA